MPLRRLWDIVKQGKDSTFRIEGLGPALQLGAAALPDLVPAGIRWGGPPASYPGAWRG